MSEHIEREPIRERPVIMESVPPAVELLSDPSRLAEYWPSEIATNPEFLAQVESRKQLNDRLDVVLANLPRPDISLQEAVTQGNLTEDQVAELYISLSGLLNDDDYKRVALYLPFEFFPNPTWTPTTPTLIKAVGDFRTAYRSAWEKLLLIQDVRANFVDGDVLDIESRKEDLPRVVKAAHLIPKLVESGMLHVDEVMSLLESSKDELLRHSITETLSVLADNGLIQESERTRLLRLPDTAVHEALMAMSSEIQQGHQNDHKQNVTATSIAEHLAEAFHQIDAQTFEGITSKREAWLKKDQKRKATELAGDTIKEAIVSRQFNASEVNRFVAEVDVFSQFAFVDGLRKAIETVVSNEGDRASALFEKCREPLFTLWKGNAPEVRDALSKLYYRLNHLGIVDDVYLHTLGLEQPKLAGPFSENLKQVATEMKEMKQIAVSIETTPELARLLYPVVLVFGSRLKGYGSKEADIDVAVFVKPGTQQEQKDEMRSLIKKAFAHEKVGGEAMEFWLKEVDDGLVIEAPQDNDHFVGEPTWTHVLFGAAWEGNEGAITELRQKLLARYFVDRVETIDGRSVREIELEELERDTLQYRLMHKGYEKFYPSSGGIKTPHADSIDGGSTFWDSGYRQTATKLFASRVFLPKIHRP